jgi:hypothetical protein
MITILTQNKDEIIDCYDIFVNGNHVDSEYNFITADDADDRQVNCLGVYATEERAKEVVLEIWERTIGATFLRRDVDNGYAEFRAKGFYEMPKE